MSDIMVNAKSIYKSFKENGNVLEVLKGVDLTVNKGEIVALMGHSGAGKSTLLQIIGGLDSFDSGELFIDGKNIKGLSSKEIAWFRAKTIGFVFQFHHLLPDFTAIENIVIPYMIAKGTKKDGEKRAKELLEIVGLENRINHYPAELSGGERQRVALARALVNNPALILADEPTGNLDSYNGEKLIKFIFKLNKEFNQTFFIATHDNDIADKFDKKYIIDDGVILT